MRECTTLAHPNERVTLLSGQIPLSMWQFVRFTLPPNWWRQQQRMIAYNGRQLDDLVVEMRIDRQNLVAARMRSLVKWSIVIISAFNKGTIIFSKVFEKLCFLPFWVIMSYCHFACKKLPITSCFIMVISFANPNIFIVFKTVIFRYFQGYYCNYVL